MSIIEYSVPRLLPRLPFLTIFHSSTLPSFQSLPYPITNCCSGPEQQSQKSSHGKELTTSKNRSGAALWLLGPPRATDPSPTAFSTTDVTDEKGNKGTQRQASRIWHLPLGIRHRRRRTQSPSLPPFHSSNHILPSGRTAKASPDPGCRVRAEHQRLSCARVTVYTVPRPAVSRFSLFSEADQSFPRRDIEAVPGDGQTIVNELFFDRILAEDLAVGNRVDPHHIRKLLDAFGTVRRRLP